MIKKILIVGFGSSGKRYNNIIKKHYPNILVKIFSQTNIKNYREFYQMGGYYESLIIDPIVNVN